LLFLLSTLHGLLKPFESIELLWRVHLRTTLELPFRAGNPDALGTLLEPRNRLHSQPCILLINKLSGFAYQTV